MLPEQDRQLLTAYVDGELSSRQTRQVRKLLHRCGEARVLYRQLKDDSRELHNLPRVSAQPGLAEAVVQVIRRRPFKPRPLRVVNPRHVLPVWLGYAAAAAVLAVVCSASYFYFAQTLDPTPNVVDNTPVMPPKKSLPEPIWAPDKDVVAVQPEVPSQPPEPDARVVQAPKPEDKKPPEPRTSPEPPKDPDVLTAPATEMVELKIVDIGVPFIVKLRDLEQAKAKADVLAELNKAKGFRVEFPCRNGTKAYERLLAACKGCDVALHVDKEAADRLKHPQLRTDYAVYLEDLTPEELTHFLQLVAAEDKKPDAKKNIESQFDRVVMVRMNARDRKELTDLLGADPTVAAAGPLGTDVHKAVSDQTAGQIAAALAGQGGAPPRPDAAKTAAKAAGHAGVVVEFSLQHPVANSTEVKRYFDNRKPARPGTLQLFFVIRETGN